MYFDSHCHLDKLTDPVGAISRAKAANVNNMVCISVDLDVWPEMLQLVTEHDGVYASVGVHPGYADIREPTTDELVDLADHPQVVAIGETGLDYAKPDEDYEWQRERFRKHIRAAKQTGKPLIIHTRNALDDTLKLLREEDAVSISAEQHTNGIIHCFTESLEAAQAFIELGFYISISGIVTFKSASLLQQAVQQIPLERLLIETDAPWLAPVPHRGKENEPALVTHTAEFIAELHGVDVATIAAATAANAKKVFAI